MNEVNLAVMGSIVTNAARRPSQILLEGCHTNQITNCVCNEEMLLEKGT